MPSREKLNLAHPLALYSFQWNGPDYAPRCTAAEESPNTFTHTQTHTQTHTGPGASHILLRKQNKLIGKWALERGREFAQ